MKARYLSLTAILLFSGCLWVQCPISTREHVVRGVCADLQAPENLALELRVQVEGDVNCHFELVDNGRTAELVVEGDWYDLDDNARQLKTFFPIEQDCVADLLVEQGATVERLRYLGYGKQVIINSDGASRSEVEMIEVAIERDDSSIYPQPGPNDSGQVECQLDTDGTFFCCFPIKEYPDGGRIDAGGP